MNRNIHTPCSLCCQLFRGNKKSKIGSAQVRVTGSRHTEVRVQNNFSFSNNCSRIATPNNGPNCSGTPACVCVLIRKEKRCLAPPAVSRCPSLLSLSSYSSSHRFAPRRTESLKLMMGCYRDISMGRQFLLAVSIGRCKAVPSCHIICGDPIRVKYEEL